MPDRRIPHPVELTPGVAYLAALDPWIVDNVWSLSQGQAAQVMLPVTKQPTKHPANPLLADGGIGTVAQDPDTGAWFYWYGTQVSFNGDPGDVKNAVAVAVSTDGITDWALPDLGTFPQHPSVSGVQNICWLGVAQSRAEGPSVILDPAGISKWLMICFSPGGIHAVRSDDGLTFDPASDFVLHPGASDGQYVLIEDERGTGWLVVSRHFDWRGTGQDVIDAGQGRRVAVARVESLVAPNTSPHQTVMRVDAEDVAAAGFQHMYECSATKHASGLYLAMPHMFRQPDLILGGIAWSRDPYAWHRPPERKTAAVNGSAVEFTPAYTLPVGGTGPFTAWDAGLVLPASQCFVEVDDEWRFYYSGWDGGHDVTARRPGEASAPPTNRTVGLGVATMRREGIACWRGPSGGAVVSTRPMLWGSGGLFLNVLANGGAVQVRVMPDDRIVSGGLYEAISGYSFSDCTAIPTSADDTRYEVTWAAADIRELAGQIVRIEVYLEDSAELYALGAMTS